MTRKWIDTFFSLLPFIRMRIRQGQDNLRHFEWNKYSKPDRAPSTNGSLRFLPKTHNGGWSSQKASLKAYLIFFGKPIWLWAIKIKLCIYLFAHDLFSSFPCPSRQLHLKCAVIESGNYAEKNGPKVHLQWVARIYSHFPLGRKFARKVKLGHM